MNDNKLLRRLLPAILGLSLFVLPACNSSSSLGEGSVITQTDKRCNYEDNLDERADSYISRCRKGGIRREFPSDYYGKTLREIKRDKSANGKKAYKLLNDGRFKK